MATLAAADRIEPGFPLGLRVSRFPVGTRTHRLFQKAKIVLWRTSKRSVHLEVWRTFACSVEAPFILAGGEG
jgi:heterotetrameric sarcosine oxidase gamma subunit